MSAVPSPDALTPSRREALRALAAGMALGLASCGKPEREIVPYTRMPERLVPGEPVRYATSLDLSGYARGVLVTAIDGRPIKIEGNPRHPASLGATDVFAEAEILSLYDPDRSRVVLRDGGISSREAFLTALRPEIARLDAQAGRGLRILTGRVGSPTLARQLAALLERWPDARWSAHEASIPDDGREGARAAFGRPLLPRPRPADARVLVTLEADILGPGPDSLRLARGWADARRPGDAGGMSRHYAFESGSTATGAKADHRVALSPDLLPAVAVALAAELGADVAAPGLSAPVAGVVAAAARDLRAAGGRGLVLAGASLPPATQALAHWINGRIDAPVDYHEPAGRVGGRDAGLLAELAQDLASGSVETLVVLDANPAYDAPGSLGFADLVKRARLRIHAGQRRDETAALCTWHVPVSHPLESWSDGTTSDGVAAIIQPLVRPLYGTTTLHEVMAAFASRTDASAYDLVRETWRSRGGADFERWWRHVLHEGVIADTAAAPVQGLVARPPGGDVSQGAARPGRRDGTIAIALRPDPCLWDGRFANNAWLQELPKPLTKQVWGNALALGPADAERLGVADGDVVRVAVGDRAAVEIAAIVDPGQAEGCGAMTLGGGRTAAGPVGDGVGADVFALQEAAEPFLLREARVSAIGRRAPVLTTATVVRDREEAARSLPVLALAALAAGRSDGLDPGPLPTFLPDKPRAVDGSEHAWGMVIDTAACIGCNACVTACQSENNVPVVGPEEIARGRTMHWLRLDVYDGGSAAAPKPGFQPVPCMHCEHAPCEPVCPVAASVHDSEGLNVQVYNRCVGTRFCEANCPYKVRRFNFFGYADGQEYADLGRDPYRARSNPDVTVRARGVMEKCTYCVQRISRERRAALRDGRSMPTDSVRTACQGACPTRAITFGDLKDPASAVVARKADPRHYGLLAHLGTRPRTTYLAEVVNPSPELKRDGT